MYSFYEPFFDSTLDPETVTQKDLELQTIMGKDFKLFIEMCFSHASFFSMTRAPWGFSKDRQLEKDLAPFFVRTISTDRWFCYGAGGSVLQINLYKSKPKAKDVILNHFSDIFLKDWESGQPEYSKKTLEDLCFFKDDELFLGTVTHEYICDVFPPDAAFGQAVQDIGRWVCAEDCQEEKICLAEFN